MTVIIDIPEDVYTRLFDNGVPMSLADGIVIDRAIRIGTPLPKGHGDLIDVSRKITVPVCDEYDEYGEKTMTVLEALNRWSDEGVTVKDVIILADEESEEV